MLEHKIDIVKTGIIETTGSDENKVKQKNINEKKLTNSYILRLDQEKLIPRLFKAIIHAAKLCGAKDEPF